MNNEKQEVIDPGHDPRNIDNGSGHDSVHDSVIFSETLGMSSGSGSLISLKSSILSDITCTEASGSDSSRENIGLYLLSEKMPGDGNDEILTTEEEQLSIVDSIRCSMDVNELDPEGSFIFTELLEEE